MVEYEVLLVYGELYSFLGEQWRTNLLSGNEEDLANRQAVAFYLTACHESAGAAHTVSEGLVCTLYLRKHLSICFSNSCEAHSRLSVISSA